jgi:hypothetical protein
MSRLVLFLLTAILLATGSKPAPADDPAPAKKEDKKDDGKGDGFDGRTKAGKARLLKEFGGSEESEEAVMLGLAWLTQMQQKDGSWQYDGGGYNRDHAAATGMAMLAFLGAGQSHAEGRYKQTVQAGLDWLVKNVNMAQGQTNGQFNTISNMYSQGIATLALVEAYGMTKDKQVRTQLKPVAQAAINYIQRAQGNNGSWGYVYGTNNDTSIVGWQIQALHSARLTQDLTVDDKVIKKAIGFLDFVGTDPAGGQYKSQYGYSGPNVNRGEATALTSIGLLCRYYIDGWRPENKAFAIGSKGLMKLAPSVTPRPQFDLYYYYYATQVVRFYGGEEWKTWNEGKKQADGTRKGGMQDWLIELQSKRPTDRGSWDPDVGFIGRSCGRMGTTCLALLTLEVYYRYDPQQENKPAGK